MKKPAFHISSFLFLIFIGLSADAYTQEKFTIRTLKIKGNTAFSDKQLHKIMVSRPATLFSKNYFLPTAFQEDLKSIEQFYRQHGYLEMKIKDYQVIRDSIVQQVSIRIQLQEGPLTRVAGVSLLGNRIFTEEELRKVIPIAEGDPFQRQDIEKANVNLLRQYANQGYLEAQITPDTRINDDEHTVLIDFIITENNQFTIGDIQIKGLEKTDQVVIYRELNFHSDEIVDYSKLLKSQRKLYLTGLFQSVFIRPQTARSGDPQTKDILIETKENIPGEFNFSAGYGSIDRFRGGAEIFYNNLGGMARKAGLITKLSVITRRAELSFTEPYTLGSPWQSDLRLTLNYVKEPSYNLNQTGGKIVIGRQFLERSKVSLTYRHENNRLHDVKTQKIPAKLKNNTRSFTLDMIYDTRNNLFNTTQGAYVAWSNEGAGAFFKGTNIFVRSVFQIKYFHQIGNTVLGSFLDLGWMDAPAGLDGIALNERFYAGGNNVLRSFAYKGVGPVDVKKEERIPTGGRYKLTWNLLEIRQPIYKMIGIEGFLDAGNIWAREVTFQKFNLRYSLGLGIRLNTPLGLVRLDYAVSHDPRPFEKPGMLYFSMGQAF